MGMGARRLVCPALPKIRAAQCSITRPLFLQPPQMYTGQRPYGNMKQQQLVEEVVMRGLRPKFPSHAPPAYVNLAQACWSGSAQARPTFDEVR